MKALKDPRGANAMNKTTLQALAYAHHFNRCLGDTIGGRGTAEGRARNKRRLSALCEQLAPRVEQRLEQIGTEGEE